ncbi:DUF3842 family protein [Anaeromusa acidaminophila]|jgi:NAD(P)-dependent dehydrogenase (short-subunit alcohol dehydrogenase family)|uniref:DUF3842 family protein n=1 Tax=Anaeromusa acidaminophila TaxID=81464 RepID=UPI000365B670|nr:DUF3842 family protein [Anaeromusa acidaminophila]
MRIAVIDGQGGGMGKIIVDRIRREFREEMDVLALGTNALATAAMLKAGANEGATGENAIVRNVERVDIIVGPLSILLANAMLGELTPRMAEAIASTGVPKIVLPLHRENVEVLGSSNEPLPHLVDALLRELRKKKEAESNV